MGEEYKYELFPYKEWPDWCKKTLSKTAKVQRIYESQWPNGYCLIGFDIEYKNKKFTGSYLNSAVDKVLKSFLG